MARTIDIMLFACAGFHISGGAILGGTILWALVRQSYYFWTTDLGVELGTGVLLLAGSLLCLPACWLCALLPYNAKSFSLHVTLMCVVTATIVLMSSGLCAAAGLARELRSPAALNASMHQAMIVESNDATVRGAFHAMQTELQCCGAQSYKDWYRYRPVVPRSCCRNGGKQGSCDHPDLTEGCVKPALIDLRAHVYNISTLSSGIILVSTITLFASAYKLAAWGVERALKPALACRLACVGGAVPPAPGAPPTLVAHYTHAGSLERALF